MLQKHCFQEICSQEISMHKFAFFVLLYCPLNSVKHFSTEHIKKNTLYCSVVFEKMPEIIMLRQSKMRNLNATWNA